MEKPSWVATVLTQVGLCFAMFLAFNLGKRDDGEPMWSTKKHRDLYFLSVRGGFRPLEQQNQLLEQMEKVAKLFKAKFVVNTSELGEDDPLMQNGTGHFPSLNIPWYTTSVSKGQTGAYFLKKIRVRYGKTMDIILLDTGSFQDPSSGRRIDLLLWLIRALERSMSKWCIIVGFHSLAACDEHKDQMETKPFYELLHNVFLKFRNAYLSGQECTNRSHGGTVPYIRYPSPLDKEPLAHNYDLLFESFSEMVSGFLLHRVSRLDIMTYFISSSGQVIQRKFLQA
ncbi:uncharacterized protein LOC131157505 isoform X2 [Malania oleifera]|uniref:uncharacterized protein LOC131157505 isoform X2 n=1 Tax=Malania oleifera TaxID=397392 RepID=UPI0025AE4F21|nr:uncharacterized protein LOC131157505 isoform X2 [Malania oleifera]